MVHGGSFLFVDVRSLLLIVVVRCCSWLFAVVRCPLFVVRRLSLFVVD